MNNCFFLKFITLFLIVFRISAQTVDWQKSLGGTDYDWARSIQQTTDGGYIVAGSSQSDDGDVTGNHGGSDFWVVKLSSIGNIDWQKSLGGTLAEGARSIQQTTDGGYIVAGYTISNDGDVTGQHGGTDFWVVKLSSIGNIEWQKSLGGTLADDAQSIQQTTDGGYIVAGYTQGDVAGFHGGYDFWVVKLSSTGNIEWQKSLGGTDFDFARYILQTKGGGYIVAGSSKSTNGNLTSNQGSNDVWIIKLSSLGNLDWQKSFGGTLSEGANSIQQTTDDGYIIGGTSRSNDGDVTVNHGGADYWVIKLSSTGNMDWQKSLGGTGDDYGHSIQLTSDGGYIVAGQSQSNDGDITSNHGDIDCWVVKLSNTGSIEWQKSLGGTGLDDAYSILESIDGGYIITGQSQSNDGNVSGNQGSSDFWVIKLSPIPLGINEVSVPKSVSVYPNPSSNFIEISGLFKTENYKIYNSKGTQILNGEVIDNQKINIKNLSFGLYFLKFENGNTLKFIKE